MNTARNCLRFFMPDAWSHEEVEATASDYFEMLARELRGETFNKAEHNRQLQRLLNNRTPGAIERKHQNISAFLIDLGYPYIDGYKPLGNYQDMLRAVVEDRLSGATHLQQVVAAAVQAPVEELPSVSDILSIQVAPPVREDSDSSLHDRPQV